MKKFLNVLVLLIICVPLVAHGIELPELYSDKVLLYDMEDEKILAGVGIDERSSIASLTKIMTTITAIEAIEDLDEVVTIDQGVLAEIPYDASVAGLKLGMQVTYRDLLYASILPSGADATTALAHNLAGSTQAFVELMNEKAQSLGLEETHFSNVTGYDIQNHYSTPREVLKILLYSLKNPLFEEVYKTRSYTLSNGLKVESTLNAYNRFMNLDLSFIKGSKTGYTGEAGMCMSAIINTKDRDMILITLGAPYSYTSPYNLKDTLTVYDYLEENFGEVTLFSEDEEVVTLPVEGSTVEEYVIKVPRDIEKYTELEFPKSDLAVVFDGAHSLSYKNVEGTKIGDLKFYFKDKLLATESVLLEEKLTFSLPKFIRAHKMELVALIAFIIILVLVKCDKTRKKSKKRKARS